MSCHSSMHTKNILVFHCYLKKYNFRIRELIMSNVIISNTIIKNSIISAPIISNLMISKLIISYSIIFTLTSKSCLLFKFRLLVHYLVTTTINGT